MTAFLFFLGVLLAFSLGRRVERRRIYSFLANQSALFAAGKQAGHVSKHARGHVATVAPTVRRRR